MLMRMIPVAKSCQRILPCFLLIVGVALLACCAAVSDVPIPSPSVLPQTVLTSSPTVLAASVLPVTSVVPDVRSSDVPTLLPTVLLEEPSPTAIENLVRTPAPLTAEERGQVFEEVWRTVKQHYLYADFHGVDWDEVHDFYASRVLQAQSQEAFYADMSLMVARLDDHHSRFVPPMLAQTEDQTASGREVEVGIGVLTTPKADGAFVRLVYPDSPAARADIRSRDRIIAVDGQPYVPDTGDFQGPVGSTVRLNVVRPGEKPRDVVLVRQEVQAHIVPTYRRFPGDIGYVSIPTMWINDMDEQVSGALTELVSVGRLRGLVLDVRANRGGWSKVLSGVLSHFVRGQVGMFFDQYHVRPLVIEPPSGPDLRTLPLVVLVDGDTASYAEVLAAVLQQEAHALVVGMPSAGNTETIYAYTLRDGSRLWLAQEGFRLQNGVNLEGVGVQPSASIDVDWTRYSEDDDPQLLEALRLLGAGPK